VLRSLEIDDRLAGLDADPHCNRTTREPVAACLGGAERADRIVRMGRRRAEQREHRVADVLLDGPAILGDDLEHVRERFIERSLEALRRSGHDEFRRAGNVEEEARNEAPLGRVLRFHRRQR
jgi:hypothetical protein